MTKKKMLLEGPSRRQTLAGLASLVSLLAAGPARAQALSRPQPLRLIVPFAPGGALDSLARTLAERTQDKLGPVIVENRAGLRGSIGSEFVAKAAPDGTTLLMGSVGTHAINPWIGASKLYDPIRDFTPITLLARMPNVLVMNADTARKLAIGNVAELVAYAHKNPGKLSYGSIGMGSTGHIAAELFKVRTGTFITHLPYAGVNPALRGLMNGEVDVSFQNLASAVQGIRAGKLKALAVSTIKRSSDMPELPTVAESPAELGLAGFDVGIWFGLFGPAKLSHELTQKFNSAFVTALGTPEMRERLDALKAEASPSSPEQLAALVKSELARHELLAKRSGARLD